MQIMLRTRGMVRAICGGRLINKKRVKDFLKIFGFNEATYCLHGIR